MNIFKRFFKFFEHLGKRIKKSFRKLAKIAD